MNASAWPFLNIFEKKLRLEVPLFQRQYVWSRAQQWEPLWEDISRKFTEALEKREDAPPHFLGAMVLDQKFTPTTYVERRQVIDGQQRLITFQIFLSALRDFCKEQKLPELADEIDSFIVNKGMMSDPELEKFKVWPTQLDRKQFTDVITAGSRASLEEKYPIHYRKYARKPDARPRMVEAYVFFYGQLLEFFLPPQSEEQVAGDRPLASRLEECFQVLKSSLQVVVIDLNQDGDSQVIFETLNARGEPLLPADLLRNFIFLRAGREHLAPEELYEQYWKRFGPLGLKVLSLFFVDRVANYASETGIIRKLFEKAFNDLKEQYSEWKNLKPDQVQAAYSASTKTRSGESVYEDSSSGESKKDEEAYDLIMKSKEKLLSFDTKEAFIFSHSALREGWDNPNVFQICTLNQTASEMKKRQEIGRGVRLAVNQDGERIHDPQVNILTVVANQSYEQYVSQLQEEITDEYGKSVELPPKPGNARKRVTRRLKKEYVLKYEFKELWDKIKTKTKYSVEIDSEKLIDECVKAVDELKIKAPRVVITKAQIDINKDDTFEYLQLSAAKTFVDLAGRYPLPNLAETMEYLLENTTPPIRLTRKTLIEIFLRTKNKKAAIDNPFEFSSAVVGVLKEKVADFLVNGIKYEKINEWYEMSQLEASIESWEDCVVPANRSIYDIVEYDSDTEKKFVRDMEKLDQIKMYVKLPSWFTVRTPIGEYNPDWAIVWEDRDAHDKATGKPLLYLVRETKSTTELDKLRPDERRKITCGMNHFCRALGVDYKIVTSAKEIPEPGCKT